MTQTPERHESPARRTAAGEQLDRLRSAATTGPGRLRTIGALLTALMLAFGGVTAWQVSDRAAAAQDVIGRSAPVSADAAEIYRSLAEADTTAAGGFLTGGQEPGEVRQRYEKNIRNAAKLITEAAENTAGSAGGRAQVSLINQELPRYTGLVETARTYNRQGVPLGGAYLRHANEQMRTEILPAARMLYEVETARLGEDYADAGALPWPAWLLGLAALAALARAQYRMYRRTNRVFNPGLVVACAATGVLLLWLLAGHTVARAQLHASYEHGAQSVQVLNEARINALRARGDESLTLVARGSGSAYDTSFQDRMALLAGPDASGDGGALRDALLLADDQDGRKPVEEAEAAVREWQKRHTASRASDDAGDYRAAVDKVIGPEGSTGECFDVVSASLQEAIDHEQAEFEQAAGAGRGALTGLAAGAALLAVLGAAGAVLGIGRRLSEYR